MKKIERVLIWAIVLMLSLLITPAAAEEGVITLPANLQVIEEEAFFGDQNIRQLFLPEGLRRMEERAFAESGLQFASLPQTLEYIANNVFEALMEMFYVQVTEGSYAGQWAQEQQIAVVPELRIRLQLMDGMGKAGEVGFSLVEAEGFNLTYQWYLKMPGAEAKKIPGATEMAYEFEIAADLEGAQYYCVVTDGCGRQVTSESCTVLLAKSTPNGLIYANDGVKVTILGYEGNSTELIVPQTIEECPVTRIDDSAFMECATLQRIELPEGIEEIGAGAFGNCEAVEEVVLPSTLTYLGNGAFINCYALKEIVIPEGITILYNDTFSDCHSLTRVQLPDGLETIDDYAFSNCKKLESIIIPDSVTKLGGAFGNCISLKNVKLPAGLRTISGFNGCTSLEKIDLPDALETIDVYAFNGCTSLYVMDLPEGVTSIGDRAFNHCTALRYMDLPASLTFIHSRAFQGCSVELAMRTQENTYAREWLGMFEQSFSDYFLQIDGIPSTVEGQDGEKVTIEAITEGCVVDYQWSLISLEEESISRILPEKDATVTIELTKETPEQWLILRVTDVFGDVRSGAVLLKVVDKEAPM